VSNAPLIENELRAMGAEVESTAEGCHFTLRGTPGDVAGPSAPDAEGWSLHCRVGLPAHAPAFELDLRPHDAAESDRVDTGEAIDVTFDDETFDAAFVVEAAPSDLIRTLFDARSRAALLMLAPCRLRREGSALHLATGSRRSDVWASLVAEVCVGFVERLARARDSLEARATDGTDAAHPHAYRDANGLSRSDEEQRRADHEIEALRDARRLRRQLEAFPFGVALIATLVAGTMIALWSHC
jgi:hypothetical protein